MPIKDLSEANARLLCFGAKQMGTFLDAYMFVEESLYMHEADELYKFCEFIDNEVGGANIDNIFILFRAYKHPNDPTLKAFVEGAKSFQK